VPVMQQGQQYASQQPGVHMPQQVEASPWRAATGRYTTTIRSLKRPSGTGRRG
jgi:hypothetical protein